MNSEETDKLLDSLSEDSGSNDIFDSLLAEGDTVAMCQFFASLGDALSSDLDNKMKRLWW